MSIYIRPGFHAINVLEKRRACSREQPQISLAASLEKLKQCGTATAMRSMGTHTPENLHLPTDECKEKAISRQVEAEAMEGKWDHVKWDENMSPTSCTVGHCGSGNSSSDTSQHTRPHSPWR